MSELNNADAEIMRLATAADDAERPTTELTTKGGSGGGRGPDETVELELGSDEAPPATPEQIAEDEEKKKGRSHSLTNRVHQLTARLRDAERRAAEAEHRIAPAATEEAAEPDASAYEFGEADPNYLKDIAKFEVKRELAEERKKTQEADQANAQRSEISGKLADGMANIEKTGAEKYDDFEAKISDAVEARGGEPLPPLVSIAIAVSPAGADIAYRLATDDKAVERIETLAKTNAQQAAIAFGELEGEYLSDDSDTDLNPSDPLDLARMIGRERARRKGLNKGSAVELKTTKMADPPEKRARGAAGQFEVGDDTDDFKSFERKIMGGRK